MHTVCIIQRSVCIFSFVLLTNTEQNKQIDDENMIKKKEEDERKEEENKEKEVCNE